MIDTMPKTHTLHIEDADGKVRQYGFHLGTIRKDALEHGWDVARSKLDGGAKSVALKFNGEIVAIWDWRDLEDKPLPPMARKQLKEALKKYAIAVEIANVDKFVDESVNAIHEVADGFGTRADAMEEAQTSGKYNAD